MEQREAECVTIELTRGYSTIIDAEDLHLVKGYRWVALTGRGGGVYAVNWYMKDGKKKARLMHRLITGVQEGQYIDHVNGNTLDNRRDNLRLCTYRQNSANSKKRDKSTKSKYKGVALIRKTGKYEGRIYAKGTHTYLGTFPTQEDAALAYDEAARKAYGDFARVNFPRPGERGCL